MKIGGTGSAIHPPPHCAQYKGYVVAWCMLLLTVTSTLIHFEQKRRNALYNRNLSSEYRMHLDHQSGAIRALISDCAAKTARAVDYNPTLPNITNRRASRLPHFPRTASSAREFVDLANIACPLHDDGSLSSGRLFRAEQLAVPAGFGRWQYANRRRTASGQPAVELRISAKDGNATARNTLIALHDKAQQYSTDPQQSPNPRLLLSDRTKNNLTLTFVLALEP